MAEVTFVDSGGTRRAIDIEPDLSLMEGAVMEDVPEIEAECGGNRLCATCHVQVAAEWLARLPPPEEPEMDLLMMAVHRQDNSRLSCQIKITDVLDGLIVHTPPSQR